ncbi:MAG: hypothetical protein H6739_28595 [Alphaproteobacteria bacterium]|nr:hypothetical protein [Alphaproteobacteria bacterium]
MGGEALLTPDTVERLGQTTAGFEVYGFGWWRMVDAQGRLIGLRADGDLGQRLVVLPQARLVAVRQMVWYPGAEERDPFLDFFQWVPGLVAPEG